MSQDRLESSATRVVELAVNLDDATGEVVGAAVQALLDAGALDVWTSPIQMKKQRPGVMLSVLCDEAGASAMAGMILQETGSFGVRYRPWDRLVLDREHVQVDSPIGQVSVKVGRLGGEVLAAQPEYDAVAALAQQAGVSVRQAMDVAKAAAQRWREAQT